MPKALLISAFLAAALAGGCAHVPARSAPAGAAAVAPTRLSVPLQYYRLANGLRVVLAQDTSVPTVTVGVYYHIGFRIEPHGRTGFAHLFEHLMFQETANLAKGEAEHIVAGNGGISNGSTRFDYTNYYEAVPSHVLEPALFVEAERMRALSLGAASLQNQKDVVKNEVRVNVLNRPYGAFPWLDLPQAANVNWHNAHNFYGELDEIDAATLEDVRAFHDTYYVPANAVLVVAGDFDDGSARAAIERQFGPLPARAEPARPDVSEPEQTAPRSAERVDGLAPRPALAFGYTLPPRGTPEWYAFGLIDEILLQGEDSRLYRRLVNERKYSDGVDGGINLLGNMFDYEGPSQWAVYLVHDSASTPAAITADLDAVIAELQSTPVPAAELARARTKIRSELYDLAGSPTRFGLIGILAAFSLYDDDPTKINRIEDEFSKVTPALIRETARKYLVPSRRTTLTLLPGRAADTEQAP
jgi:predicted Zn-dependent peptidase